MAGDTKKYEGLIHSRGHIYIIDQNYSEAFLITQMKPRTPEEIFPEDGISSSDEN
jgi:hypothetical protein